MHISKYVQSCIPSASKCTIGPNYFCTPAIAKIISVKNVQLWVSTLNGIFLDYQILFSGTNNSFFKEQLLFSFSCIVKQKKISERSENFWKKFFLKIYSTDFWKKKIQNFSEHSKNFFLKIYLTILEKNFFLKIFWSLRNFFFLVYNTYNKKLNKSCSLHWTKFFCSWKKSC